jgi:hypothetical protein
MRKIQKPKKRTNGSRWVRIDHQAESPLPFESKVMLWLRKDCSRANADSSLV